MIKNPGVRTKRLALLLFLCALTISLNAAQRHTLIVNGRSTDVLVVYMNSLPYVDLQALAKSLGGSVSTSGVMVALSIPIGSENATPSARSVSPVPRSTPDRSAAAPAGFSKEFLNAGIEEMSTLREWHTALQTAIQNGIPLSAGLLQPYRAQATTNLRTAQVAASTQADHSGFQLLNNVYQNMGRLSDKYVNMRANLTYIAPDALQNDDLNQRIITCGRFLGSMAASGQFSDDGSCH
jgi:hypothetical protein